MICAGRGRTWSSTRPGPGTGWASSCCATGGCGGAGTTGRSSTRPGSPPQRFDDPALTATFGHYRATLTPARPPSTRSKPTWPAWLTRAPFADPVARLAAYRGITQLGALTLASEVCDWRRFPTAGMFMGFSGLVPSEYSSGERTRRGRHHPRREPHLRTQLIESAWAYQVPAGIGAQHRPPPRKA